MSDNSNARKALDAFKNPARINHHFESGTTKEHYNIELNLTGEEYRAIVRALTPAPKIEGLDALKKAKEALERTLIYARSDGVWINSRVKGSAMRGLQDAKPETIESFQKSAELNDEALKAIDVVLEAARQRQQTEGNE